MKRLDQIVRCLGSASIRIGRESDMQADVESALVENGIGFIREFPLSAANRVDFLLTDGIAIECKTDGSRSDVLAQLVRYARCPEVTALILVTAKIRLAGKGSGLINGKPWTAIWVAPRASL